jgi:DNA primase
MTDDRQRVLDATDIADLIGEHLALKQRGVEFVGLCPFHDDHSPSMAVVPRKGIFYCFSCGAGGNAIDFMMKYHGMAFREALQALAERAGIDLTPRAPKPRHPAASAERLAEGFSAEGDISRDELARANAFAHQLYLSLLRHAEHGRAARDAIARRGLTDSVVQAFGLGASPDRWDGLIQMARAKGVPLRALEAAGLVKRRPSGDGMYDTFRSRLMFPIHDQLGRVIAFGARKLNEQDEPKYLNSPESALFDKSSTLYALSQATPAIKRERCAIVTEGYMDAIACHAAGVENVVATLGTAMTLKHARLIRRLCDRVVLLFDGDEAGQRAADRAVEVLLAEPIDVQVAVLPGGQDPDDLLKSEGGRQAFARVIAGGEDALAYRHRRLEQRLIELGAGPGSAVRARMVEEDVQRLVELGLDRLSPIRRQAIVRRLAAIARVDERAILEAIGRSRAGARARRDASPPGPAVSHRPGSAAPPSGPAASGKARSAIEHAVACLLAHPGLIVEAPADAGTVLEAAALPDQPKALRAVAGALAELIEDLRGDEEAIGQVLAGLDESARSYASGLIAFGHTAAPDGQLGDHWRACVLECRRVLLARSGGAEAGEGRRGAASGAAPAPDRGNHPIEGDDDSAQRAAEALAAQIARIRTLGGNPRSLPKPRGNP